MEYIFLFVLLACAISPVIGIAAKMITGKKAKYAMFLNIASFAAICIFSIFGPFAGIVSAADAGGVETLANSAAGIGFISAAVAVSVGSISAGFAVAKSASTALGALSENPSAMGKAIIFVALAEGVALYGVIIAVLILNKI